MLKKSLIFISLNSFIYCPPHRYAGQTVTNVTEDDLNASSDMVAETSTERDKSMSFLLRVTIFMVNNKTTTEKILKNLELSADDFRNLRDAKITEKQILEICRARL